MSDPSSERAPRPAPDSAVSADGPGLVFLANLPDGPIVVLEGVAALIYRVLADGTSDDWVAAVADAVGESRDEVAPAVEAFVDDLLARGLLV
jgi:hypothetical protein